MEVDEGRLREMMNIINAYVDGLIGREHPDYEDICQDALIRALPYIDSLKQYSVPALFRRCVKNSIHKNIIKKYSHDEMSIEEIDIAYSAEKVLAENFMKDDVNKIIQSAVLSPKEKEVAKLYFFDKNTLNSIARKYNVTPPRIAQILGRVLVKIRRSSMFRHALEWRYYNSDPLLIKEKTDEE